jgi:hypothetical protein
MSNEQARPLHPAGYLRGFIDPSRKDRHKPLWYFDAITRKWSQKSPKEIGFEFGFYGFGTDDHTGLDHPNITLARFEL